MSSPRHAVVAALGVVALALGLLSASLAGAATGSSRALREASAAAAQLDATQLQAASAAVEAQAIASGALRHAPPFRSPAKVLLASTDALTKQARAEHRSLAPHDTRSVMGAVPYPLKHRLTNRPHHRHITATHALRPFSGGLGVTGSSGLGLHTRHAHALPARPQRADGKYVDPHLPATAHPTIAMVAVRAALKKLGQPYVWAAAGPTTFDCSGLVQWAYAHAGVALGHYTGYQWDEGRLIAPRDILPGDLILFGNPTHHVGMYLGAGWMVNAPYTGQYVDVVPVPMGVAGVVRP